MDYRGQIEKRTREINTPRALFFKEVLKRKFGNLSEEYRCFLNILAEYEYGRIDPDDMYPRVSALFWINPVMIRGFCNSFPQPVSTKDDDVEIPRPVKKARIEEDSSKAIPVFDPISKASTSHDSDYSQSPCSSGCYPVELEAVASCSRSSPSRPGAAEAYEAHKRETAQLRGRILFVIERKTKLVDEPQAYQHIIEHVNVMEGISIDTYAIMKSASKFLQGYPELIKSFHIFLPDGYRIVILSDDHDESSD